MAATSKQLMRLLRDAGYEPKSYSGRAMYGKECVSIRYHENGDFLTAMDPLKVGFRLGRLAVELLEDEHEVDDIAGLMQQVRTDDLGRGLVIYWPSAEWDDEDEVEAGSVCEWCGEGPTEGNPVDVYRDLYGEAFHMHSGCSSDHARNQAR